MKRYYIHSSCGEFATDDAEGRILPSLEHAQAEALRGAGAILADEIATGRSAIRLSVTVEDHDGKTLLVIAVQAHVDTRLGAIYPESAET